MPDDTSQNGTKDGRRAETGKDSGLTTFVVTSRA